MSSKPKNRPTLRSARSYGNPGRDGFIHVYEMSGAAATLSSLGTFGVDSFTAMLNPGQSSILAVGRTVERAVPRALDRRAGARSRGTTGAA